METVIADNTVRVKFRVAVAPAESATCTVKLEVPPAEALVGVPEIFPVGASRASPAGSEPAVNDHL